MFEVGAEILQSAEHFLEVLFDYSQDPCQFDVAESRAQEVRQRVELVSDQNGELDV